jgi:hypothetical protein
MMEFSSSVLQETKIVVIIEIVPNLMKQNGHKISYAP